MDGTDILSYDKNMENKKAWDLIAGRWRMWPWPISNAIWRNQQASRRNIKHCLFPPAGDYLITMKYKDGQKACRFANMMRMMPEAM